MPRNARADGSWNTVKVRSWVSGFFPGILWYLYALTEEEDPWKIAAQNWTEKLDEMTSRPTMTWAFRFTVAMEMDCASPKILPTFP